MIFNSGEISVCLGSQFGDIQVKTSPDVGATSAGPFVLCCRAWSTNRSLRNLALSFGVAQLIGRCWPWYRVLVAVATGSFGLSGPRKRGGGYPARISAWRLVVVVALGVVRVRVLGKLLRRY